eukprot:320473-Alexandrium_andersonii.AAC.1
MIRPDTESPQKVHDSVRTPFARDLESPQRVRHRLPRSLESESARGMLVSAPLKSPCALRLGHTE